MTDTPADLDPVIAERLARRVTTSAYVDTGGPLRE